MIHVNEDLLDAVLPAVAFHGIDVNSNVILTWRNKCCPWNGLASSSLDEGHISDYRRTAPAPLDPLASRASQVTEITIGLHSHNRIRRAQAVATSLLGCSALSAPAEYPA